MHPTPVTRNPALSMNDGLSAERTPAGIIWTAGTAAAKRRMDRQPTRTAAAEKRPASSCEYPQGAVIWLTMAVIELKTAKPSMKAKDRKQNEGLEQSVA